MLQRNNSFMRNTFYGGKHKEKKKKDWLEPEKLEGSNNLNISDISDNVSNGTAQKKINP